MTVQVLPDEPGHFRLPTNDQEILERCEFLHQVTGHPATLATGDSDMRVQAQSRGIDVYKLSDDDLLPRYFSEGLYCSESDDPVKFTSHVTCVVACQELPTAS